MSTSNDSVRLCVIVNESFGPNYGQRAVLKDQVEY